MKCKFYKIIKSEKTADGLNRLKLSSVYSKNCSEQNYVDSFFLVMPYCNTDCMNIFLKELSKIFSKDKILLVCDGAAWHKSMSLEIPENIDLLFIPPYTPEMNPIEQIWKEIRKIGFKNECFSSLDKVVDRLCVTICSLSHDTIKSVTGENWILDCF